MADLLERHASGDTSLDLGDRNEAWDAGEATKALDPADYQRAFFWRNPDADPKTLAAYKLPFASPDGGIHAVWKAVHSAAGVIQGSMGGVDIPNEDVPGIRTKIEAFYAKARKKYGDDSIVVPWARKNAATDGEMVRIVAPATMEMRDAMSADDAGAYTFTGHAAVFDTETTLVEGRFTSYREVIAPGAFTKVLASDPLVHFNLGHDMNRSMACTTTDGIGGLTLAEDDRGLAVTALLARDDPDVQALASKMAHGVISQMSFAFRVGDYSETVEAAPGGREIVTCTILEVSDLIDVCACARGAYPTTDANLRQRAAAREAEIVALRDSTSITRPPSGVSQLVKARVRARLINRR